MCMTRAITEENLSVFDERARNSNSYKIVAGWHIEKRRGFGASTH